MNKQLEQFLDILKVLEEHDVDYILVGGFAVILHGMERLTADIDLFVKLVPENIDKLKNALNSKFEDEAIEEITTDELDNYPVIRYGTPTGFYIDIIGRLGEKFHYEDLKYVSAEYKGIKVNLATPETLMRMKKDTMRAKDSLDIIFLRELLNEKGSK
jgi:hypothetical protein